MVEAATSADFRSVPCPLLLACAYPFFVGRCELVALGRLQYVLSRELGTGSFESVVPVPISPFSVRQAVGSVPILDMGNCLPTHEMDSNVTPNGDFLCSEMT